MTVETTILRQLGHEPAQVLAESYRRHGRDREFHWIQPMLVKLAEHVGKMRGEDPRGYHGEAAAELLRALLAGSRPCAAELLRWHGHDVDQALQLVDSLDYRDRRLVALPGKPRALRALEAA